MEGATPDMATGITPDRPKTRMGRVFSEMLKRTGRMDFLEGGESPGRGRGCEVNALRSLAAKEHAARLRPKCVEHDGCGIPRASVPLGSLGTGRS